ncbi:MAG TPA: heavy metal translocating P-type ATPase [Noviherbaspirillum sp.]
MESGIGQLCFHCGAGVPAHESRYVEIDGQARSMCCPGCEAVARTIVDSGLANYYRTRDGFADTVAGKTGLPPEPALYDAPEVIEQFAARSKDEAGVREAVFSLEGIRCAACVWLIERRVTAVPGVRGASLNVASERLQVRWNETQCKPSDVLAALAAIGYDAHPYDPVRHDQQLQRTGRTLFRQLFIAGLSMMQVMMYAFPVYVAREGDMDLDMRTLMNWAGLLLTIPAVFYSALPFFRGAWSNLRAGALGMDVPVALGIAAAFTGSVVATVNGQGDVYYDSVTMFIFLLLCSRYLEWMARRKAASALETLRHSLPASAVRLTGFPQSRTGETIPAARLASGDYLMIKPGEPVPADCVIVEGQTRVDLSLLTGESQPQQRGVGDALPGGAINTSQAVVARVTASARESTLAVLVKLVEQAGQGKPQLAMWADRVAAWFVGGLLLLAAIVFFAWQWIDPSQAWPIAIAVLVVSCPCALSMATPSALAAATDRLVRQGVLAIQPHVIETLHRVTHVVFDKTGTLTLGKPALQATRSFGNTDAQWALRAAAALEQSSAHPLAQALLDAAKDLPALQAVELSHEAGRGVEGRVDGQHLRLGSASFVAELVGDSAPQGGARSCVYLGAPGAWLACFELEDAVRSDAAQVVRHFQAQGKQIVLLSGDETAVAQSVAARLGIDAVHGGMLPQQKLDFVQDLQRQGAVVAMVGDGINDAAVLRGADVSFAMGSGASLAQANADAVLLSPRLSAVMDAARTADDAMRVVRQNLWWASIYNMTAIPAAALGLLNPWMAGIGMAASSALVVMNALRLRRLPRPTPERATRMAAVGSGVA